MAIFINFLRYCSSDWKLNPEPAPKDASEAIIAAGVAYLASRISYFNFPGAKISPQQVALISCINGFTLKSFFLKSYAGVSSNIALQAMLCYKFIKITPYTFAQIACLNVATQLTIYTARSVFSSCLRPKEDLQ